MMKERLQSWQSRSYDTHVVMYHKEYTHEAYTEHQLINNTSTITSAQLVQKDFGKYEIILKLASNGLVNNYEKPFKVSCCYYNSPCTAECYLRSSYHIRSGKSWESRFQCHIEGVERHSLSGYWEFFLPYAHFGEGDTEYYSFDRISFTLSEVEWELRYLYESNGAYDLFEEIKDLKGENGKLKKSDHAVLRVSTQSMGKEQAEETATIICHLLQLALGNHIGWAVLNWVDDDEKHFVKNSDMVLPECKTFAPLRQRPYKHRSIKNFLEGAYPQYLKEESWWWLTLDWYAQHCLSGMGIQTQMMIVSMLLDRVSTFLLKNHQFPCQISEKLKEKKVRDELKNILHKDIISLCPEWNQGRTNSLMQTIGEWNARPSYKGKIAEAYKIAGVVPPSDELLKKRHQLLHEGKLKLDSENDTDELFSYWREMSDSVTELLLRMLGYKGDFDRWKDHPLHKI